MFHRMSLSPGLRPYNANSLRTSLYFSTPTASHRKVLPVFVPLFLLATFATLTIWNADPLVDRIYECLILLLAAWTLLTGSATPGWMLAAPLAALPLWGVCQWALQSTVDRDATWLAALRFSGFSATALVAFAAFETRYRARFLEAVAWIGFLISLVSVIAYYTSPSRVFWLFDVPYPDVWGPFLSRNNFAQFLELTLPVALWLARTRPQTMLYGVMSAVMLAAGLASASRAGAFLLVGESVVAWLAGGSRLWRRGLFYGTAVMLLAAVGGDQALIGRFFEATPLAFRDVIYRSSVEMIASQPVMGYGLGTYALVYPRFAETDFGYRVEHAHNDWLEWTAEGGWGFAAIWVWLVFLAARRSLHHPWAWGIPAVFMHALVDFPMARLGVAAWAFILIGAIERSEARPPHVLRRTT